MGVLHLGIGIGIKGTAIWCLTRFTKGMIYMSVNNVPYQYTSYEIARSDDKTNVYIIHNADPPCGLPSGSMEDGALGKMLEQ